MKKAVFEGRMDCSGDRATLQTDDTFITFDFCEIGIIKKFSNRNVRLTLELEKKSKRKIIREANKNWNCSKCVISDLCKVAFDPTVEKCEGFL